MSGGSGKKKENEDDKAPTPTEAYGSLPSSRTFQPTLPGFQDRLASQLSAGFGGGLPGSGGGSPADFNALLSGLYQPMNVMRFLEPISQTAAGYDKAKHLPILTGNPALDRLLMGEGKVKEDEEAKKT